MKESKLSHLASMKESPLSHLASPVCFAIIHHTESRSVTRSFLQFQIVLLATHDNKEKAFNKLITFYDRLDGTVSENIYFKFVVNVMWEPVPGSTLIKLCSLVPPFETVPFQRRARVQFQRASWLPYCMKVKTYFL